MEEKNTKQRYLGVDLGDVRTGLAVSDALGSMAHGLKTVKPRGKNELCEMIRTICEEEGIRKVIIGNPVNMDGSHGPRSEKAQRFAEFLSETTGLETEMVDERMTTMAAARFMNETDTRGKKRKDSIDTLSAEIILQNYLDSLKSKM